jgi:hypothetical protein
MVKIRDEYWYEANLQWAKERMLARERERQTRERNK